MGQNNFSTCFTTTIGAYEAIEKVGNVADWWGVTVSGNTKKQNDEFTVTMGGNSFFNFVVAELVPGKKVAWLVTDCNMPWYTDKKEWANTRLVFEVNENNGLTELKFTHEGLTPEVECYKDCEPGWTHWINTSLFSYFTTGKGVFRQPTK